MWDSFEIDQAEASWRERQDVPVDWTDMVRLAAVVSLFAAAAAMALVGHVSEMTIVISVIVLATMASWFHLEHPGRQPRPAHVHRHDRFRPR